MHITAKGTTHHRFHPPLRPASPRFTPARPAPVLSLKAKLTSAGASHDSWKSSSTPGRSVDDDDNAGGSWEFPDLLATSEALAAEMLSESMATVSAASSAGVFGYGGAAVVDGGGGSSAVGAGAGGRAAVGGFYTRSSSMPVPPPPEFHLSAGDVDRHRCGFGFVCSCCYLRVPLTTQLSTTS